MLRLTKKTDYGVIALIHLCTQRDRVVSAREISEKFGVPLPILSNILKALSRHGIVHALRGTNGGYRLQQDAERIHLTHVIEAIEGPFRLTDCLCHDGQDDGCGCQVLRRCPVWRPLSQVHRRVEDLLHGVTIASLAASVEVGSHAP
jgi:Rrf2 family protein